MTDEEAAALGRKHWLYRLLKWGLIPFMLVAWFYATTLMVRYVDAGYVMTNEYRIPADDKQLGDTILGQLTRALAGEDIDAMVLKALEEGEVGRATHLRDWGAQIGQPVKPETSAAIERAGQWDQQTLRAAQEAAWGGLTGEANSLWGFAGAVGVDMTPAGDLRDLAIHGGKWMVGGEPDYLIFGLSAIGLALTVLNQYEFEVPAEAQLGKAVLKNGMRFNRVSRPLRQEMEGLVRASVDMDAAKGLVRLDAGSAARLVRKDALTDALRVTGQVGGLYKTGGEGLNGAKLVIGGLTHADNVQELNLFTRMVGMWGISAAYIMDVAAPQVKSAFRVMKATTKVAQRTEASFVAAQAALYGLAIAILDAIGRMIGKRMLLGRLAVWLGRKTVIQ